MSVGIFMLRVRGITGGANQAGFVDVVSLRCFAGAQRYMQGVGTASDG